MIFGFERIIAAIYRGIENRRPDGTPYFRTHMALALFTWLHVFQMLILIKLFFDIDLIPATDAARAVGSAVLFIGVIFLLRYLLPLEKLKAIEIKPDYVKKINAYVIVYFIYNIILLMILIAK